MNYFKLTVSTPDGNRYSGEAEALFLRGSEGDLAVLANHAPFVTPVKSCVCRIVSADGNEIEANIRGGLLSVADGGDTILLTTTFDIFE